MRPYSRWLLPGLGAASVAYGTQAARTYARYGRVKRSGDELLDRFMPEYEVADLHGISVDAPPDVTLAAARETPMESSRIVRAIFRARELILRGQPAPLSPRPAGLVEATTAIGWGVLASEPTQLVVGAVTRPWEASPTFRALPPEEFAAFAEPGYVKIVWSLRAEPAGDGGSRLSTETRAIATDRASRRKFRLYWSLLSPGILLIRRFLLPIMKDEAEHRARPLPGDDIIARPQAEMTYEITIDAPPAQVWPWLLQMGCQRGGWYSWDKLDNGGTRSAERIIPELQHLEVGDIVPMRPEGRDGFVVLRLEPERALVLGSSAPDLHGTWAFVLEPLPGGRTRLVNRYRAAYAPGVKMTGFVLAMKAAHAIMERKQLRTIKHHAEHSN